MTIVIMDLINLGYADGLETVSGINNIGEICGSTTAHNSYGISDAFTEQGGTFTYLPPGETVSASGETTYSAGAALAINQEGVVAGYAIGSDPGNGITAAIWQNGVLTLLPTLGLNGMAGKALAINDADQVVGTSNSQAALWQNGKVTQLSPAGTNYSIAYAINDSGQIVGETGAGIQAQATLWQNGTATDIAPATWGSQALAINNSGEIVGFTTSSSDGSSSNQAFSYQSGTLTTLPGLSKYGMTQANSVNSAGLIVGESTPPNSVFIEGFTPPYHAVAWVNGAVIDLNSLLPTNSGWVLQQAMEINDANQVIGTGTYNGLTVNFELTLAMPLAAQVAVAEQQSGQLTSAIMVADSAAAVQSALDGLQSLVAAGHLTEIILTDRAVPTLTITTGQLTSDAEAIHSISSSHDLAVTVGSGASTITGQTGQGITAVFSGMAGQYSLAPGGDGTSLTVSGNGADSHLANVVALQFSDVTDIVASQTANVSGAVSSAQVTELYGAVFGRVPDVSGLAFYEAYAAANPATPFVQFAQWFLSSSEYTANAAHKYAQTVTGDEQFITDSYDNLLHRAASAAEVAFYETNVIAPMLQNLTAGTASYMAADLKAHAQVLVYFSQSAEFLGDVQVTAQHPSSAQHWLLLI